MEFLQNIKKNYDEWTRITPQGLLYDRALFWLFVILLLIGLVAVTSASIPYSSRLFNDPFYFAKRDAIYVLLSLLTCYISLQISSSQWEKWHAKIFYFLSYYYCLSLLSVHRLMAQNVGFHWGS
ncbi:N-acetylglucosaminyl transferase [Haemophilus influenzae 22.4-21]|uniref:Probable peptidoglycan glycosyltransferase FtsW n=1 Tax=Haemophilus influenzae 22.4-21 TaxID=375063 RepID=A4NY57_HAEIF|nr:N-acetylglucosaminyl transferase [Haemophilus influenzae 22.4-21]